MKQVGQIEQNKTIFTRMVGAIFTPSNLMAVYNTRNSTMKWSGMGEFKTLYSLLEIARMNSALTQINSVILFGQSDSVALRTLMESNKSRRMEFRFDAIYKNVYFIPMNDFGVRLLRLPSVPDWNEKLLSILFDSSSRSYNRGSFEYDAYIN